MGEAVPILVGGRFGELEVEAEIGAPYVEAVDGRVGRRGEAPNVYVSDLSRPATTLPSFLHFQ